MPLQGHIVLQTAAGATKTPLRLLRDQEGRLQYSWRWTTALPPEYSSEEQLRYATIPPTQELVWNQDNWSAGALKYYWAAAQAARYAHADKVWALTPNELSLSHEIVPLSFGVPNGEAEITGAWTGSGVTLTVAATTAPLLGVGHLSGSAWGLNDYITVTLRDEIANSTIITNNWQGKNIKVVGLARGATSTDTGDLRIQIVESGGVSTPTTNGAAVTMDTSYRELTAQVALQADTTGVEIRIQRSSAGADMTFYVDSVRAFGSRTLGGDDANSGNARMLVSSQGLFAVTDDAIYIFNETWDYWALVRVFTAAIPGAGEVFDDRLFVPLGTTAAYEYSNVGAASAWTPATGADPYANRFSKTLNTSGNWAMAKTLRQDELYITTDPTGAAVWGTAFDIGKNDHNITNIYQIAGVVAVGKQDGFYQYLPLSGNRFINTYPAAERHVVAENFARGTDYNGKFLTIVGENGLLRYDGTFWEPLRNVLQAPGFTEFGERARAFGTDGDLLYVIVEDLLATTGLKQAYLMSLEETEQGWRVHVLGKMDRMNDALDIMVYLVSGNTNKHLFIQGHAFSSSFPVSYRIPLPDRTRTPRLATNKRLALSGTLVTSYWDGNRPQVQKAFNKLDIISEGLSGTDQYITVAYQVDNDSSWTNINSTDSTFETSPNQTIGFNSGVTGRRIRLRFTFTTTSAAATPIIRGFVLHASWRPTRLKEWTAVAAIEQHGKNIQGVAQALPVAKIISNLDILATTVAPIQMIDVDDTTQNIHITHLEETQFQVGFESAGVPRYERAVLLTLQEVKTS